MRSSDVDGGALVAAVLRAQGTQFLFTVCGGHISPILVGAKAAGIRVVDTRHEATAVFAADAVARLTGRPGVAAVTAGPGVTNVLTAVTNARQAQSPLVLLAGAAPTMLQGRGALQDIDQPALLHSQAKWVGSVSRVRDIVPAVERAFRVSQEGVPGPVAVEFPADLLYRRDVVSGWYGAAQSGKSLRSRVVRSVVAARVGWMFHGAGERRPSGPIRPRVSEPDRRRIEGAAERLGRAERPVIVVGSQAIGHPPDALRLQQALARIGAPVYLSGTARGLLGAHHPLLLRHGRRQNLRAADVVVLAGVPADFRLDYGRVIGRRACLISANRSRPDLRRNRRPMVPILGDPYRAMLALADTLPPDQGRWTDWQATVRARDDRRDDEIARQPADLDDGVNPVALCREVGRALPPDTVLVGDGGDFVATASYVLRPGGPLRWLDPGVFGTLGVGAGFALGAALVRPDASVWVLFGDGAVGYSLAEFDTFVRHGLPVVAVVGNDASWSQIARAQVEVLHDDVGTVLAHTRYDRVAAGFGAVGLHVDTSADLPSALAAAREAGRPALVDVRMGRGDFRAGSISM